MFVRLHTKAQAAVAKVVIAEEQPEGEDEDEGRTNEREEAEQERVVEGRADKGERIDGD
jgi:hypothetical protein